MPYSAELLLLKGHLKKGPVLRRGQRKKNEKEVNFPSSGKSCGKGETQAFFELGACSKILEKRSTLSVSSDSESFFPWGGRIKTGPPSLKEKGATRSQERGKRGKKSQ